MFQIYNKTIVFIATIRVTCPLQYCLFSGVFLKFFFKRKKDVLKFIFFLLLYSTYEVYSSMNNIVIMSLTLCDSVSAFVFGSRPFFLSLMTVDCKLIKKTVMLQKKWFRMSSEATKQSFWKTKRFISWSYGFWVFSWWSLQRSIHCSSIHITLWCVCVLDVHARVCVNERMLTSGLWLRFKVKGDLFLSL